MARVNLDPVAMSDLRFDALACYCGEGENGYSVRGRLQFLWHIGYEKTKEVFSDREIDLYTGWLGKTTSFAEAMAQADLAEALGDGNYRVKGLKKRYQYIISNRENAKRKKNKKKNSDSIDDQPIDKQSQSDGRPIDKQSQSDGRPIDQQQSDGRPIDQQSQSDGRPIDQQSQSDGEPIDRVSVEKIYPLTLAPAPVPAPAPALAPPKKNIACVREISPNAHMDQAGAPDTHARNFELNGQDDLVKERAKTIQILFGDKKNYVPFRLLNKSVAEFSEKRSDKDWLSFRSYLGRKRSQISELGKAMPLSLSFWNAYVEEWEEKSGSGINPLEKRKNKTQETQKATIDTRVPKQTSIDPMPNYDDDIGMSIMECSDFELEDEGGGIVSRV